MIIEIFLFLLHDKILNEIDKQYGGKKYVKKIISILVSIATAFLSLFLPATKTEAPADKENFIPIIRFAVFSDSHVSAISDTRHTPQAQKQGASSPSFSKNAELKIKRIAGKYKVTVPAAESTDGNIIALFRITVFDNDGKLISSEYKVNNYWLGKTYENIVFKVKANKGSTIKVVAENAYGMQYGALCAELS